MGAGVTSVLFFVTLKKINAIDAADQPEANDEDMAGAEGEGGKGNE